MRSGILCDLVDGRMPAVVTSPRSGRERVVKMEGPFERFVELLGKRGTKRVDDESTPRGRRRVETTSLVCSVGGGQYEVTRTRAGGVEIQGYGSQKTENFLVMSDVIVVTPRETEVVSSE